MNLMAKIRAALQPKPEQPKRLTCPHCGIEYTQAKGQKVGLIEGLSADCVAAIHKANAQ